MDDKKDIYVDYEKPINDFRRLIQNDDSQNFQLIFSIPEKSKTIITFNISINKARVISKKINEIYQIDPTIDKYEIKINELNDEIYEYEEAISTVIKSTIEKVQIKNEKLKYLNKILFLLGEEYEQLPIEINNFNDAISYLNTEYHFKSIEFISQHFDEFIKKKLNEKITDEILEEIIDHFILNIKNEEKIFNCIKKNQKVAMLYLINAEYNKFNDEMKKYFYENLDDEMIEIYLPQIIYKIRQNYSVHTNIIDCNYKGNELSGIFSYFKEASQDDSFKITSGGYPNPAKPITNLISYDEDNLNETYVNYHDQIPNSEEGWIEFDFIKNKVNLSSYTLRSGSNGSSQPRAWKIFGSIDGEIWDVLDAKDNNSQLSGAYQQHRFECVNNNKFYRYIRYSQKKSLFHEKYNFGICLACIEFFGSISST